MSDSYLPLLMANIQDRLVKMEAAVAALTARADEMDALLDGADVDDSGTYMDGTPVR